MSIFRTIKNKFKGVKHYKGGDAVQSDGLTIDEHIAKNDAYIKCFIKFKHPMPEMKEEKRALWVSEDLTCIIGMFTYMNWYNLYLRVGLGIDVAEICTIINSLEQERNLKSGIY